LSMDAEVEDDVIGSYIWIRTKIKYKVVSFFKNIFKHLYYWYILIFLFIKTIINFFILLIFLLIFKIYILF
jgi:hypothetical protein